MKQIIFIATIAILFSPTNVMSAPICKTSDSLDILHAKLVAIATVDKKKNGVPEECFGQALYVFDNIARSKHRVTDEEFHNIVSLSIIIDPDDGESDAARSLDKIIHTDLSRLRPLFRKYAAGIDNKCTRLEYISNVEDMDCQVEHPFDPGTDSVFCDKYRQEHRPSAELLDCRNQN